MVLIRSLTICQAYVPTSVTTTRLITSRRTLSSSSSSLSSRTSFLFRHQNPHSTHDESNKKSSLLRMTTPPSPSESSSSSTTTTDTSTDIQEFSNKNNKNDQIISVISSCGGIKVTAATVRNLVNDVMLTHSMTEVPADALGRSITCGLLMSNGMPKEHTVQLTMSGDGPLRGIVSICNGAGEVRGYVGNPSLMNFSLNDGVGKGTVQIVKNHPDWPNPYNGITAIRTGDIDEDVGTYLAESEQRSCALAAATAIERGILCKAAGGYLVEKLPGCDSSSMTTVESNLRKLVEVDGGDKLPTNLLLNGVTPLEIAEMILEGIGMTPLQQIAPTMKCDCSEDRLFRSIRLLPREEVDDIIAKHEMIEARCHFCGKQYRLSPEEVQRRFETAEGDPSKDDEQ